MLKYNIGKTIGLILTVVTLLVYGEVYIVSAAEYYHLRTNTTDFPQVSFEGILIENGIPVNYESAGLIIAENGVQRSITEISCNNIDDNKFALLFVLDMSSSVQQKNLFFMTQAIKDLLNTNDLNDCLVGITGFNDLSFLIHDFSNDKQSIITSLDELPSSGSSNLENAVLQSRAGVIDMFKNIAYRKEVILISDGSETGESNAIINGLLTAGIRVNTVTCDYAASELTRNIAMSTGAYTIDKVKNYVDMVYALNALYYSIKYQSVCKLMYESFACNSDNVLNMNFTSLGISRNTTFTIGKSQTSSIIVEPEFIDFGVVTPPNTIEREVRIKATVNDIHVDNIIVGEGFQIVNEPTDFELKKGEERIVRVRYIPNDTNYIFSKLIINGTHCKGGTVRLSGGSEDEKLDNKTISVLNPNGGEHLIVGHHFNLTWDGVLPNDTVSLEYSTNNGINWISISQKAYGLSFNWEIIPNTISNNCLLRINKLSKQDMSKSIVSLKGMFGKVVNSVWKDNQNEIYTGSTDGFIRLWNTTNGEPLRTIAGGIEGLVDFDLSPNHNYTAYISENGNKITIKNNENEFEEFDFSIQDEVFDVISWNPINNFMIAGTQSGKIYLWDFPDSQPVKVIDRQERINVIKWNPKGNQFAAGLENGYLHVFDVNGDDVISIEASDQKLNSFSFNPTGSIAATSSMNEYIQIWDLSNGQNITTFVDDMKILYDVAWDPQAKYIASSSIDSSVILWLPGSGQKHYKFKGHNNFVSNINWRSDGKFIASSTNQGELFIWSPDDIPFNKSIVQSDTSDNVWSIVNPNLQFNNISFNGLRVGDRLDSNLAPIIVNPNDYDIVFDTIYVKGGSKYFSINAGLLNLPYTLKSGSGLDMAVSYHPTSIINKLDTLIFKSGMREYRLLLFAYPVDRMIEVEPKYYDFGIVKVGQESDIKIFKINNVGTSNVFVERIKESLESSGQFSVINFDATIIPAGSYMEFGVKFTPDRHEAVGMIYDIVYDGKVGSDFISLTGAGASPQISVVKEHDFPLIICENEIREKIVVRNNGNDDLIINKIELNGIHESEFELDVSQFDLIIPPNDSSDFSIHFKPSINGNFDAEIDLLSNMNADRSTVNTIKLTASKDISDFEVNHNNLTYFVTELNEPQTKELHVVNTGSVPINWEIPLPADKFRVTEILPELCFPGDSSKVLIEFTGSEETGRFEDEIGLLDSCKTIEPINLTAFVGPNDARLRNSDKIQFPDVICIEDTVFSEFIIYNEGSTPLIITDIEIESASVFQILTEMQYPLIVFPGEEIKIDLSFNANKSGINLGQMIIIGNAVNCDDGICFIELEGTFLLDKFRFSENSVKFEGVIEGEEINGVIEIFNEGELDLSWNFPFIKNEIKLDSISTQVLEKGESALIYFTFTGGNHGRIYSEQFILKGPCKYSDSLTITVNVNGIASLGLRSDTLNAKPGDTLEVPLYLFKVDDNELPVSDGYSCTLEFNSSLLVPLDRTNATVKNGKWQVHLITPSTPIDDKGLLALVPVIATLGNSEDTEISITNSFVIGNRDIKILEIPGLFILDSLCYEGGVRLVGGGEKLSLSQNRPNPVIDFSTIEFTTIEYGRHQIVIYDMLGNQQKKLFDTEIIPGKYSVGFHLNELPVGNYIFRLISPTTSLSKKLTIHR
ncbi:MAG: choice-of-anchor D domain-containing protein [Candidatus Kapaibacterium sp.]